VPTYEYRCPKGHVFERVLRFSDPDPEGCEICGASPVTKVLYPVAVHFKGSGFYSTDYGRGRKKDAAKEGGDAGGTGGDSGSTDSKPTDSSAGKKDEPKAKAAEA
jgi:putative FmdB family regulatory protein